VTGGRPSSFQGVAEWGTPWLTTRRGVRTVEGAGITRPQTLEMIRPRALESKKRSLTLLFFPVKMIFDFKQITHFPDEP